MKSKTSNLIMAAIFALCCATVFCISFGGIAFAEDGYVLKYENDNISVQVIANEGYFDQDAILSVEDLSESDEKYSTIKNYLSNPDKLKIYGIKIESGNSAVTLDEAVTLKIKIPDEFDAEKINIYFVTLDGEKEKIEFSCEDDFAVMQTEKLGYFTISQTAGFKPVSPSHEKTNSLTLTLIVVFGVAVLAVVGGLAWSVVKKHRKR
jgi:hypothetical protein